ncbi:hypothetical protein [Leifsonia sp. TF02-11]|uniref:hypothetical protein n=1 Tax=Leifsonia sp. TF02-11 TaxID=2815212 RepID=UPI001AA0D4A6|nr:hypothetical protein [Leifsonia sp. TF02-11]MBO1737209.1 hypothetical protein [Leifsonia sp. TF02-11]
MPRRRTLIVTSVAVVAVAAIGVGVWAFTDTLNASLHIAGGPTAAAEKTPTAAPTPVDEEAAAKLAAETAARGLTVGTVLTPDQAKVIGHYWQGNLIPYKMADGSQVLISRDQPLPENVKADAGRKVTAAANESANSGDTLNGAVEQESKKISYATGHQVIVVAHVFTALAPAFETTGWTWMTTLGDGAQFGDAATAAAAVQSVAPAKGAEIIVSQ